MADESKAKAVFALINAHVEDLLSAPPEEIVEEARDAGVDLALERDRHLEILERAMREVGRKRLAAARTALDARRLRPSAPGPQGRRTVSADTRRITLAARNGGEQSERDHQTVQDDLDELSGYEEPDSDA